MSTFEGVRRMGPPVAVQKLREDFYLIQVGLSETPSADWKRLFYDTQQGPPADFLPRAVEMSGSMLKFRSEGANVESRMGWIDKWIDRANQKEAAMAGRLDEERRRRREEFGREQQELNELNARWAKL
ncbi:MAG TPA: hypothetical protein VKR82_15170 [Candidatus Acidoferrales bacterium]|nr:hypothetical protein [Candidatus Acidoferrales bacterium]